MMLIKKIKKILLNPKSFYLNSFWFKQINLDNIKHYNNLFVITHLGQLNQVETLIVNNKISNSLLVVLYTNKNKQMPKLIQNQYNKGLFDDVIFLLLPNNPNNYNLKSLVFMKRNYTKLLEKTKPKNLFLLSFENHYSLLATFAKRKNINLSLIDEGTATYKKRELSEYTQHISFQKKLLAKILKVDSAFEWFVNFDEVHAAFPKLLKQTFNAKKFHYFFAYEKKMNLNKETIKMINHYDITSNDLIYVNQRYTIEKNDFTNAIISILNNISCYFNTKIFIKLHPKDNETLKVLFKQELNKYENLILIEENEFLIEPAIKEIRPKGVIGLTSTTLIYTSLISPQSKIYSIKPWFVNIIKKSSYNNTGIEVLYKHYNILEQFKDIITIIESKEQLNNLPPIKKEKI